MNTVITFHSPLAEALYQFVEFKRMQGYGYSNQILTLSHFDRFLAAETGVVQDGRLTIDTLLRYVAATTHLAVSTRESRLGTVREFSRQLHATSAESAILPGDVLPAHPRTLRFFRITPGQIVEVMAAAPAVLRADSLRTRSIATVIGLLYCTGLRISEALGLTPRDIAADGSVLHVVKGKLGKERLVPLSPSAYAALTGFLKVRKPYTNKADSGPLFIDAGGTALTRKQVHASFHCLCRHCGIWGTPAPRIHDLRHNYACQRLALWREDGADVNTMLPILATAMGHVSIMATQRYLHIDAVALRNAADRFSTHFTNPSEARS